MGATEAEREVAATLEVISRIAGAVGEMMSVGLGLEGEEAPFAGDETPFGFLLSSLA